MIIFYYNIEIYVKKYNIDLLSKIMKNKLYGNIKSFLMSTYYNKNSFIDFVTRLIMSIN